MSPFARILELQNHPLVLQQHRHADVEQTQRWGPARGSGERLTHDPVARLDPKPPPVALGDHKWLNFRCTSTHLAENRVDQVLAPVLPPLLPHLVADHDVDRQLEGRVATMRPLERVRCRVGAAPVLPPLRLTGAQAQRDHCREPLRLQPREDGVGVEAAVEEDGSDLALDHLEVVEGGPDGGPCAAVPRVEAEGGEAVGAVSALLLLGLDHLTSTRILGLAVVGTVREVDGDIDGFVGDERSDLMTEGERQGALGIPEEEIAEEPAGGAVGVSAWAQSAGPVNRAAKDRRPEEQICGIVEGRGAERSREGVLQEREEPPERSSTHVPRPVANRWNLLLLTGLSLPSPGELLLELAERNRHEVLAPWDEEEGQAVGEGRSRASCRVKFLAKNSSVDRQKPGDIQT